MRSIRRKERERVGRGCGFGQQRHGKVWGNTEPLLVSIQPSQS
jgi:hypothetical protein